MQVKPQKVKVKVKQHKTLSLAIITKKAVRSKKTKHILTLYTNVVSKVVSDICKVSIREIAWAYK